MENHQNTPNVLYIYMRIVNLVVVYVHWVVRGTFITENINR